MNNINFNICKASTEQHNTILEKFPKMSKEERDNSIIYVAIDKSYNVIGRIVIIEKELPEPIIGKCWYLINLFIETDFRRMGIATQLVNETKRQAVLSNVIYLYGSANSTSEATFFWFSQGFTLNAYGKKEDDKNKPLNYGNYNHMFSYCVHRKPFIANENSNCIKSISTDEIMKLIDTYVLDNRRREYFKSKANDLLGFVAIGENGNTQGVVIAFLDSMQSPLDCNRLFVNIFVEPNCRNQGIGACLIYETYKYAQENDIVQLTNFDSTEDNIGFWYKIGFDIFFWDVNSKTGKRATTAMLRVN